jgi:hypothetical protein
LVVDSKAPHSVNTPWLRTISRKARISPFGKAGWRTSPFRWIARVSDRKSPLSSYRPANGRLPDPINVLLTVFAKQLLTTF